MMNIFRPSTPIATQMLMMVQFTNCTTPASIAEAWPVVQRQVLVPNNLKTQWSHDYSMAEARPR